MSHVANHSSRIANENVYDSRDSARRTKNSGLNFSYGYVSSQTTNDVQPSIAIGLGSDRWGKKVISHFTEINDPTNSTQTRSTSADSKVATLNYPTTSHQTFASRGMSGSLPTNTTLTSEGINEASSNASKQRLVVASQALEIQQLQDMVRRLEKEARERSTNHNRQIDVLEERLHEAQLRTRQLEGDVQLIGGKLRAAETRLEVQLVEEKTGSGHIDLKDEQILRLRGEVTQLRLSCKTLEEEKNVLLQKLLDERSVSNNVRMQYETTFSENQSLRAQIKELSSEETSLKKAKTGGENGNAHMLSNVPISSATQTTTDTLIPLSTFQALQAAAQSFDAESQVGDDSGADTYVTARTVAEDLKYLLSIEKERVVFYSEVITAHTKNIEQLNGTLKNHMQTQLSKLNQHQLALKRMMADIDHNEEVDDSKRATPVDGYQQYGTKETTRLRSPPKKSIQEADDDDIERENAVSSGNAKSEHQGLNVTNSFVSARTSTTRHVSPPLATSSNPRRDSTSPAKSTKPSGYSSKYSSTQHHQEMAALKARLEDLQSEHQAAFQGRKTARGQTPLRSSHYVDRDFFDDAGNHPRPLLEDLQTQGQQDQWVGGGSQPGSILRKMVGADGRRSML